MLILQFMKTVNLKNIQINISSLENDELLKIYQNSLNDYIPEVQEIIKNEFYKRTKSITWNKLEIHNSISDNSKKKDLDIKYYLKFILLGLATISIFINKLIKPLMTNNFFAGLFIIIITLLLFWATTKYFNLKIKQLSVYLGLVIMIMIFIAVMIVFSVFNIISYDDIIDMMNEIVGLFT